ncbi:glycosyltransferase [Cognatishimia sp. F0-27]|uniref:glycosyltransferase n=1 Tax=Cognatishimia sp. F0-27 TaxID=2816855 RepID=UPI001D0C1BD1|nr:glycosyltransferase [Cognatishimia sp. F0-27]MCC1494820.1 glycosyltransferase [Cognatishimia sp. F0-27]
MFRRLKALYARYAALHLAASLPGPELRDSDGATVGYVDRIHLGKGRLQVSGWTLAARVRLVLGDAEIEAEPMLPRTDVARKLGIPEHVGFDLTIPVGLSDLLAAEAPGLVLFAREGRSTIPAVPLPVRVPKRARLAVLGQFVRDMTASVPSVLGWLRTGDPIYRARIKERLKFGMTMVSAGPLERFLFQRPDDPADPPLPRPRITILLPVYNAYDLLQECLDRVAAHTDLPWRLIVIEDGSPDPRIKPFLKERLAVMAAEGHDVTLLENPENLGFIRSVNRGFQATRNRVDGPMLEGPRPLAPMEETPEGPVVLLNSDAFVPEGWASRLIRPFLMYDDVATVTPMSNDAEIFTAPVICARTLLTPGQGDAIDRTAQTFRPDGLVSLAPTGVGFCMAMGREWLAQVPRLDTAFGRGYGEEVDWCQKVARKGGKHLGLPGLFVEHRGGESFGSDEKLALVAKNNEIVARRYPGYDQSVQDFIAADPMVTARLALGMAWAGSLDPDRAVPVYLAHTMGGGADHWLEHRIAADLEDGLPSVILRVGGPSRWRLELVTPMGRSHGQSDHGDIIRQLLAVLPKRRVVYSCGVGDSDPVSLPAMLTALMQEGDEAEILFHDFFPLSPAYTLLESDGVYHGAPIPGQTDDPAHTILTRDGDTVDLATWQAAWHGFAAQARLITFSAASARDVGAVWPDLADRIVIRPHTLRHAVPRLPAPGADAPPVLTVLGNIGLQKGAAVLQALAAKLADRPDGPRLVLIGNIDPAYALPASVTVHGSYAVENLPALAARYGVTHWLIPSIWPETFCYTAHETLATGLPVLAFDIGAQGEAVTRAPNGHQMPFDPGADLAQTILTQVDALMERAASASGDLPGTPVPGLNKNEKATS